MKASKEQQLHTLENAILAMRDKIEEQIPIFKQEPLSQNVTVGTGENVVRQNPTVSEFRALVKDYGQAIKVYRELSADSANVDTGALESLRAKFKVIS